MARSWVASWLVSVVLACIQTVVVTIAVHAHSWSMVVENMGRRGRTWHCAACGLASFCPTCAPLIVLRGVLGWTLTREATSAIPVWRLGVEDLFASWCDHRLHDDVVPVVCFDWAIKHKRNTCGDGPVCRYVAGVCAGCRLCVFRSRTWSARLEVGSFCRC